MAIIHPATGKPVSFGRNKPSAHVRNLRRVFLEDYQQKALPEPPKGPLGRADKVPSVIARDYGNADKGDCTKAAQAHLVGVYTGIRSPPAVEFADKDVLSDYFRMTGGQDTGLDEISALNDWRDNPNGLFGGAHKIDAYVTINATIINHVKFAIWAMMGVYGGLELPDAWNVDKGNATVWPVAGDPNPDSGHAIPGIDYDDTGDNKGVIFLTWGFQVNMSYDAVVKYFAETANGELHVPLTKEVIDKASGLAPNAVDWSELWDDAQDLAA